MRKILFVFSAITISSCFLASSQVFHNNGAGVSVEPGTFIHVVGSAQNSSTGVIEVIENAGVSGEFVINGDFINNATAGGDGIYRLSGDWLNNSVFNAGTGAVYLYGAAQILGGTSTTAFYDLILEGTGNKTQTINQTVVNTLNLNDRELQTENFTMFVLNTNPIAIVRTTGFVSSLGAGVLSRNTNSTNTYLFPVGSSVGTNRYRPVEIAPVDAAANTFTVRMANVDATTEGFDRSLLPSEICHTNPYFYHRINRDAGTSAIDLSIFYDQATDGDWDGIANWTTTPQWEIVPGSFTAAGAPYYVATANNWNTFNQTPYILYLDNITADLGPDTSFCQGSSVSLDAGAGYDSYTWSPTGSGQFNNVTTAGTYYVTVTQGICSAVDSVVVNLNPNPVVDLGPNTNICDGDVLSLDAGAGYSAYLWNPAGINQTFDVSATGTYAVTVTDSNGCQGSDNITVTVLPNADATITTTGPFCSNDPQTQFTAVDTGGDWWGTGITVGGMFDPSTAGAGTHVITYGIDGTCGDTSTVSITVHTAPVVNLGTNISICDGDILTLDAGAGYTGYSWTPSGSTQTIDVTTAGTYSVTVTDSNGCQGSDNITVTVLPNADASITTTGPFCSNDPQAQFTSVEAGGAWSGTGITAGGMFDPATAGAGTHVITYGIAGPCGDTSTVSITVHAAPVVNLGTNTSICDGDILTLDAGAGYTGYSWTPSGSTQTIDVTTAGTYSVTVTDSNGCQGSDNITVAVLPNADATILTDGPFCSGDGSVQFTSEDGGGSWNGNGISTSGLFNPSTAGAGLHTIIYTIPGQCGDADSTDILVNESPAILVDYSDETCIGASDGTAWVIISGGLTPYIITWAPNQENTDSILNLGPGLYTVMVYDQNDCGTSATVDVAGGIDDCMPPHVVVPNIFSPNGDGVNDVLYVLGEGIIEIEFVIYTRWGEKVFETTDINNGWDGTYKNKPMDPAVFVWFLNVEFRDGSEESHKGDVTLVR